MNFLATKEIGPQGLHTCISKVKPSHNRKFQSPKPSHRNSVDKNPHTKISLREVVAQNRTSLDSCKGGPQVWTVARRAALTKGYTTAMFSRGRTITVHKGSCTTQSNSPQGEPHHTILKGSHTTQSSRGAESDSREGSSHHTKLSNSYHERGRSNFRKYSNNR
jgi:hypothetical protein